MSRRLSDTVRDWRLHALASGVPLTVAAWLIAGRSWVWWLPVPAAVHLSAALLVPQYARAAWKAGTGLHRRVGGVLAILILGLVYLTVVTPLGMALRLIGIDPLARRCKEDQHSNWHPAPDFTPTDRMF